MTAERVTYLVANYNNGRYFPDLLASLEDQTDDGWLCLVCDDASTDDSYELIGQAIAASPVRDRMRLLRNARNLGYGGTLVGLIDLAQTDIVQFCDPDDALVPETTEVVLETYRENPGVEFMHAKLVAMDHAMATELETMGTEVPVDCTSFQKGFICLPWSFRRTLYRRTSGIDVSSRYSEDRDLYYKLEELAHPFFVDRVLYRYRVLADSQSHHPVKKKIARQTDLRLRQSALRRRGITGFRFAYASAILWLTYLVDQYPSPWVWPLVPARLLLRSLDWQLGIVGVGTLRRPAVPPWDARGR